MASQYDRSVARHYAAYRPPLHRLILERVLSSTERFHTGLDVGCGTGYSAVALCRYCDRVIGLDSSRAMLDAAQAHPKITYLHGELNAQIQLPVQRCDIVTFAGSLFYMKTASLRNALVRFCPAEGTVVVYDFRVLLNGLMATLGVDCPSRATPYDYTVSLSDWDGFVAESSGTERLVLDVSEKQLAHLLLADSRYHAALLGRFPNGDPFATILAQLERRAEKHPVPADLFFTRYRVQGH